MAVVDHAMESAEANDEKVTCQECKTMVASMKTIACHYCDETICESCCEVCVCCKDTFHLCTDEHRECRFCGDFSCRSCNINGEACCSRQRESDEEDADY